jgi:hypothetical protein
MNISSRVKEKYTTHELRTIVYGNHAWNNVEKLLTLEAKTINEGA